MTEAEKKEFNFMLARITDLEYIVDQLNNIINKPKEPDNEN